MVICVKIETFYNYYDLKECNILSAISKGDELSILLELNSHLNLMGNGIRPELDVVYKHLFVFIYEGDVLHFDKDIKINEYKLLDNKILLDINDVKVYLTSIKEIINNYV